MTTPDIVLIARVKTKRRQPCAAQDLYVSPLFVKQRVYAEKSGVPWSILSAEYRLVVPDEWLNPYERYLPDTPSAFRSAWGTSVAARLQLLAGPLSGRVIAAHAGRAYIKAIRPQLKVHGANLIDRLSEPSMGERLAWYGVKAGCAEQDHDVD